MSPPQVSGKWSVVEYKVVDGKNDIYTPEKVTYTTSLEQNGRFVQLLSEYANFYGVWKFNCKSGWELYMVNNVANNDIFNLSPTCVKKGIVQKMDSINYEAGTKPIEPKQVAQVSYSSWTRV